MKQKMTITFNASLSYQISRSLKVHKTEVRKGGHYVHYVQWLT
uniref:Uncharacterized protein n=1 Tax=Vibrio tasmaniensis TaxID=212663 RepID=A0A0H3ZL42_9VIBR|nr:hypothetical protein [Vibrio tasmaniensis]AKN36258.1 hypothetical protein [Vibrio tasmaniensis]AKN36750.1 hypothetical protein [Vibrio tasmaniensis]AKN40804.1 hypothetical protein [Vibrio tasmaniensis]